MTTLRSSPFGLSKGTIVSVKARAKNSVGWGDFSAANTVGAQIQTEPGAMAAPIKGSGTGATTLEVTWSAPTDTGLSSITSYNLQYKLSSSSTWSDAITPAPSAATLTSTVTTGVQSGQLYDFRVRAMNLFGWGAYSSTTSFKAASVPADITDAVVTQVAGSKVRFEWGIPSTGGLSITGYLVEFQTKAAAFTTISSCVPMIGSDSVTQYCEVPMLSFVATPFSLVVNDTIVARVKARNELGDAANYSPLNTAGVTVKTVPLKPPTAPFRGSTTSWSQIEVVINAVTGDYTGQGAITSYELYWDN